MKRIVVSDSGWMNQYPPMERGKFMRMIFSLAAENGYEIVVASQHWPK